MIDYFVGPLGGIRTQMGRSDTEEFSRISSMRFRSRPAGVVETEVTAGTLDLVNDCERARSLTQSPMKFTMTGPHMLSRTLLDRFYRDPGNLSMAIAQVFSEQVSQISADVIQIDEANITGAPQDAEWAVPAMNLVLDAVRSERALHLCFGNYGGQTIQQGTWNSLVSVINQLHVDHVILELSRRSEQELEALREIDSRIGIGLGVIDIKSTIVETADEVARRIERAEKVLGEGRVRYIHPDCGFWMLKRSIADRKMTSLVEGRNRYLGIP